MPDSDAPRSWHERDPSRLVAEAEAYRQAGYHFELDREEYAGGPGSVAYRVWVEVDSEEVELTVYYPEGFPYVRPTVVAPALDLALHQHPCSHAVCVIPNTPDAWDPDMRGAYLVEGARQLIADSRKGEEVVMEHDVGIPEPISSYYQYTEGDACLVDRTTVEGDFAAGGWYWFEAQVLSERHLPQVPFRVKVVRLGLPGLRKPSVQPSGFGLHLHLDAAPDPRKTPSEIWNEYVGIKQQLEFRRNEKRLPLEPHRRWLVLTFPEEGPERGQWHRTLLLLRARQQYVDAQFARPFILDPDAAKTRNPKLISLSTKSVAIVGLGSLGSLVAEQLARAGVGHLTLIDDDVVEASNLARHIASQYDVGLPKVTAVAHRLGASVIGVDAQSIRMNVGVGSGKVGQASIESTLTIFRRVDLVVCCVGASGVHALVDDIARHAEQPVVHAWVTNGAWGGTVLDTSPNGPCIGCHEGAALAEPPSSPDEVVWATGCGLPSFTGAVFDIGLVASCASHATVDLLLGATDRHNHLTISTGANGGPASLQGNTVARSPQCPHCSP